MVHCYSARHVDFGLCTPIKKNRTGHFYYPLAMIRRPFMGTSFFLIELINFLIRSLQYSIFYLEIIFRFHIM